MNLSRNDSIIFLPARTLRGTPACVARACSRHSPAAACGMLLETFLPHTIENPTIVVPLAVPKWGSSYTICKRQPLPLRKRVEKSFQSFPRRNAILCVQALLVNQPENCQDKGLNIFEPWTKQPQSASLAAWAGQEKGMGSAVPAFPESAVKGSSARSSWTNLHRVTCAEPNTPSAGSQVHRAKCIEPSASRAKCT